MKNSCLALAGLFPLSAMWAQAQEKPNIVFIYADDYSFNSMSDIGQDHVFTPNLDELRSHGMYFSHAFNQGGWNGAISMASRAMMVTGMYMWKAHDAVSNEEFMTQSSDEDPHFWSEFMRRAGYTTYMTGKWHVFADANKLFDVVRHVREGMPPQTASGYAYRKGNPTGRKFIPGVEDSWQPYDTSKGGYWKGGKHWSEVVADDAVDYIDMAKQKEEPFFMYLAFNAAHDPRQAPKRNVDMYPIDKISIPRNFTPTYPYYREMGCGEGLRDEQLAPFPRTEYSVKVNRRDYYALITHMDEQIGRIIRALKASGKYDNTYIMFTADHGLAVGDHGLMGKQNMYDASMRVPLIVCGPGIKKGKCDNLVYLQDVMATALDIADSEYEQKVDFKSLLPFATRDKKAAKVITRNEVYGAFRHLQRMIRTDRYKMIVYQKNHVVRLYDMKKDPFEMKDLARQPKYRKLMDELMLRFEQEQIKTGDSLDVRKAYEAFFHEEQK